MLLVLHGVLGISGCPAPACPAVPQQELLLLLATSCTTPPLQSFLASTLGEANLRRLARAVDTTATGLHTALLERVMPLVELVVFLLGELRGLVSCRAGGAGTAAGSWLGLQVRECRSVTQHTCSNSNSGVTAHHTHSISELLVKPQQVLYRPFQCKEVTYHAANCRRAG